MVTALTKYEPSTGFDRKLTEQYSDGLLTEQRAYRDGAATAHSITFLRYRDDRKLISREIDSDGDKVVDSLWYYEYGPKGELSQTRVIDAATGEEESGIRYYHDSNLDLIRTESWYGDPAEYVTTRIDYDEQGRVLVISRDTMTRVFFWEGDRMARIYDVDPRCQCVRFDRRLSYDAAGNLAKLVEHDHELSRDIRELTWRYNEFNWVVREDHFRDGHWESELIYQYDALGRLLRILIGGEVQTSYEYSCPEG